MKLPSFSAPFKAYTLVPVILLHLVIFCTQATVSARADELLLGLEPEHNIFDQVERYRALSGYLSEELGIKVNLTILSRYGEVTQRFKSLRLDGAFLSSYTAAMSINELELDPVVSPVGSGGSATSRGYIIVRKDSGIETIDDMRDKSAVFVDPSSTEGYIFPLSQLSRHGINDQEGFFRRTNFSGSHASVVYSVLDSRADIGAVKDSAYMKEVRKDPSIESELIIIARSPEVPETTLCLRGDLDPDLRQKLETVLLTMDRAGKGLKILKEFGALRFVPDQKAVFSIIAEMAGDAGIEMKDPAGR